MLHHYIHSDMPRAFRLAALHSLGQPGFFLLSLAHGEITSIV